MDQLISILIPNYNKAPYLRETLDSILAQTYSQWECIIVDDHSTDASWNILQEYAKKDARFRVALRPDSQPKGGNECRNYAFSHSKGEFIQWFDSDDWLYPEALEVKIAAFENNALDFVVTMDADNCTDEDWLKGFINSQPAWLTPGALIRKSFLITKNIKWSNHIMIGQDRQYNFDIVINSSHFRVLKIGTMWKRCNQGDVHNIGSKALNLEMIPSYAHLYVYFYSQLLRFDKIQTAQYLKMNTVDYYLYLRKNVNPSPLDFYINIIEKGGIVSKTQGWKLRIFDFLFRARKKYDVPLLFGLYRKFIFKTWHNGLKLNAKA